MLGSTAPRLFTPPLRDLDDPDATFGYDLIDFAAAIGLPFKPWQEWLAVHAGELLADGRPRFRTVLALVARQNGKTTFCFVLILYWMHIECVDLVLGTSTSRETAKSAWRKVIELAEGSEVLAPEYGPRAVRETIGEEAFTTLAGAQYLFAAPNRRAGRSKTVHRLVMDELREHQTWDVWNAAVKAMTAIANGQAWAITNQGDDNAVVLDSLRDMALEYIETGAGDPRLGLFEWSSPTGSDPLDPHALALANPQLGDTILLDSLIGDAMRAVRKGGEELAGFRTETMCIRVQLLDPAIDPEQWAACGTDTPLDLAPHRRQTALCLDVALDGSHASLVAAAHLDGVTHLEVVKTWQGFGCTKAVRDDLPDLLTRIKPRAFGWFPDGPAAAIAADLRKPQGGRRPMRLPRGVLVAELKTELPEVCMGLNDVVAAGQVRHPRDAFLTKQVDHTQRLHRGDRWTFTREGTTPVDGTYAAAGAAHLARTLPPPLAPLVVSV